MRRYLLFIWLFAILISSCNPPPTPISTSTPTKFASRTPLPPTRTTFISQTPSITKTKAPTKTSTITPSPTTTPYIYVPKMMADGLFFSYTDKARYRGADDFSSYQDSQLKKLNLLKNLTKVVYLTCDRNIEETMIYVDQLKLKISLGIVSFDYDVTKTLESYCLDLMKTNPNIVEIRMDEAYDTRIIEDFFTIAKTRNISTATINSYRLLNLYSDIVNKFDRRILDISITPGNDNAETRAQTALFNIAQAQKKWPSIDLIVTNYDYKGITSNQVLVENYKNLWAVAKSMGGRYIMSANENYFTQDLSTIFDGNLPKEIWKQKPVLGEGTPEIVISDKGVTGKMKGRVIHLKPSDYKIVLYIQVNGGWWVKPYFDTVIWPDVDGNFETQVASGGDDRSRTQTMVLAIPVGLYPFQAAGSGFPQSMYDSALAKIILK